MDLVLHFCIDPDNSAPWRRLRPDHAKAMKGKFAASQGQVKDVTDEDMGRMLGEVGGPS